MCFLVMKIYLSIVSSLFMEMAVKNPFVSIFLNTIIDDYDCILNIYGT